MPLPFRPPLTPHEQAIYTTLPKLVGAVVSPDYWPKHEQARGTREFLAWCESHERRDFPQWLNDWLIRYHLRHPSDQRHAGQGHEQPRIRTDAAGEV